MPPITTVPDVGRSSPAAQCSSVDLPEPEGPITAVKVPWPKPRVTPSRAVTAPGPEPYTTRTVSSRTACPVVCVMSVGVMPVCFMCRANRRRAREALALGREP
ncbi:hypothetical protein GCM10027612_74260 [Microbispora bryophytorum subsp. camponoti]